MLLHRGENCGWKVEAMRDQPLRRKAALRKCSEDIRLFPDGAKFQLVTNFFVIDIFMKENALKRGGGRNGSFRHHYEMV